MTMQHVLPSGVTLYPMQAPVDPAALPLPVLDRIAVRWAEQAGCPPGEVVLSEEELGWSVQAPSVRGRYATFVDKLTGRLTTFANPAYLSGQYRQQIEFEKHVLPRPGSATPPVEPPGTIAVLRIGPAAAITVDSRRTDDPPVLHKLVRSRLARIRPAARVRGAQWHPELLALSDAAEEGTLTGEVRVRLWRVREPGDPLQGDGTAHPCATCTKVLGVPPPAYARPETGGSPWHRFRARRNLHRRPVQPGVDEVIRQVEAVPGVLHRHTSFPAVAEALQRYLGAASFVEVPGRSVRTARFHVDPLLVADTADTLARVAGRIGAPLFPLGRAGYDGFLAIDPTSRVLLIDQTGEWLLGTGLPAALDTLLLGRAADRVRG